MYLSHNRPEIPFARASLAAKFLFPDERLEVVETRFQVRDPALTRCDPPADLPRLQLRILRKKS